MPTSMERTITDKINTVKKRTIEKIKENIGDSYFWACVDKTTDRYGRYIANIVVGKLDSSGPSSPHLIASRELEVANSLTIARVVRDSLRNLYSYLTVPTYLPDMNTLMEVVDADLRITTFLEGFSSVSNIEENLDLTDEFIVKVVNKILIINDDDEALNMMAFSRNISRLALKYEGSVLIDKSEYFRNGRALLHVVEECYCSILKVLYSVESHSPFLIKFNDIIVRLNEAGFIQHWNKELLNENLLISNKNSRGSNNPVVLTLDHLQAVFIILGLRLLKRLPNPVQEWHFTPTITVLYDYNTVHRTRNDGMMKGGKPKNINKVGGGVLQASKLE
uniref:Uncharacterized protein n=1 Tax=Timema douglasi TaxID=61478 RepID=A0A7R8ZCJ6_TIMDO|nr:unnamed protein product [Timema douglasi]